MKFKGDIEQKKEIYIEKIYFSWFFFCILIVHINVQYYSFLIFKSCSKYSFVFLGISFGFLGHEQMCCIYDSDFLLLREYIFHM